jgi:hypothetical protein
MELNDLEDYLETAQARPIEPAQRLEGRVYKKRVAKPSQMCGCGQKLSIANTEKTCFSCCRLGRLDYTYYLR